MKRIRALLAVGVLCIVGLATALLRPDVSLSAAGATRIDAVHWTLDEAHKQIVVTVKLAFYQADVCTIVVSGIACPSDAPDPSQIDRIVSAIERYWNGHKYKCWDFVVKVVTRSVRAAAEAPRDAVEIALIDTLIHIDPYVLGTGSNKALSTSPNDRNDPARAADEVTAEWPIRSTVPDYVYAHEFGHILGLDDNYYGEMDPVTGQEVGKLVAGATPDLMAGEIAGASHEVSEDMITRAVLRNGQIDPSRITCPLSADGGPSHLNLLLATLDLTRIHLYACDYDPPTTDPDRKRKPIDWKGTIDFGGSFLTQFPGAGLPSAEGKTSVSTSFTSDVPANAPGVLKVPFVGGEDIEIAVMWDPNTVLRATDAARLSLQGQSLSTAQFFPGPPIYVSFTQAAAECPK